MAGGFVSADIGKLTSFVSQSAEAITEFDAIKEKYESINTTLLSKWKGEGADSYQTETSHILENIGGIKDILDTINNGALKDIIDAYNKVDNELGEFNRNPKTEE